MNWNMFRFVNDLITHRYHGYMYVVEVSGWEKAVFHIFIKRFQPHFFFLISNNFRWQLRMNEIQFNLKNKGLKISFIFVSCFFFFLAFLFL